MSSDRLPVRLLYMSDSQTCALHKFFDSKDYSLHEFQDLDEMENASIDKAPSFVIINGDLKTGDPINIMGIAQLLNPGSQFILVANKPQVAAVVEAILAGFSDVLEDPIDLGLLAKAMDRAHANLIREQRITKLSLREIEVLRLLVYGHPNKRVASTLGISHRTVEVYRARIMEKMVVRNFAELVSIASKSKHLSSSGSLL